jgi:hypothetical protein
MCESQVSENGARPEVAPQIALGHSCARAKKDVDKTTGYVLEDILSDLPGDRLEGTAAFRRFWADCI